MAAQFDHGADIGEAGIVRRADQRPGQLVVVEVAGLAAAVAD